MRGTLAFPAGARFAFTILDDTDVATVANVEPVYRLLETLGLRATKTVWPLACPEGSRDFGSSETLADPAYREFVLDLGRRGFEIASHGATMESSDRERTSAALDRFTELFGGPPRVFANHAFNRENLYWGEDRVDDPAVRAIYRRFLETPEGFYEGHRPGSAWYWGDLASERITYARNLTFSNLNLLRVNPSMPYRDPARPLIPYWFSTSDAEDADAFIQALHPRRLDRLEREGGICILSTHLGKRFTEAGSVVPAVRERLTDLARRPGWFPPVGVLLDWMRERGGGAALEPSEWRRMQWRWLRDLVTRGLAARAARMAGG